MKTDKKLVFFQFQIELHNNKEDGIGCNSVITNNSVAFLLP